jgi:hypothetical protein
MLYIILIHDHKEHFICETPGLFLFLFVHRYLPASAGRSGESALRLIKVDDSKLKVTRRCGKPMYKDVISGDQDSKTEEWVYQRGSREFPMVITIRGQKVIRIERLDE